NGDLQTAAAMMDLAGRAAPNSPEPRYWLATFLREDGRLKPARQTLEEALRLDPRHAPSLRRLADIDLQERRNTEALADSEKAEKLQPTGEGALIQARALMELGRLTEAEQAA